MKIRSGFVSNSSSCSFMLMGWMFNIDSYGGELDRETIKELETTLGIREEMSEYDDCKDYMYVDNLTSAIEKFDGVQYDYGYIRVGIYESGSEPNDSIDKDDFDKKFSNEKIEELKLKYHKFVENYGKPKLHFGTWEY